MNNLKVTIIQSHLHWENPEANRAMFSDKIARISEQTDLIVLPEMFTTGFTMNASPLAETMQGPTLQWMIKQSIKVDAAIAGSVIIKEDNQFFNRLLFVYKNDILQYYDRDTPLHWREKMRCLRQEIQSS